MEFLSPLIGYWSLLVKKDTAYTYMMRIKALFTQILCTTGENVYLCSEYINMYIHVNIYVIKVCMYIWTRTSTNNEVGAAGAAGGGGGGAGEGAGMPI